MEVHEELGAISENCDSVLRNVFSYRLSRLKHRLHLDIGNQRASTHSLVHQVAMAVINLVPAQWSL
jgi:hypothetical protein